MSERIAEERKVAARALLEFAPPTRSLVAAAMGVTERTLTTWITQDNWAYADFRIGGAIEVQARHRRAMLKRFWRNAPPGFVRSLPADDEMPAARLPGESGDMEGAADGGGMVADGAVAGVRASARATKLAADEPLAVRVGRFCNLLIRHTDQIIAQADEQGGTLTKGQLDTMLGMIRLAERMEPMAQQVRQEDAEREDAENAALLDKILERVFSLAMELAEKVTMDRFIKLPGVSDDDIIAVMGMDEQDVRRLLSDAREKARWQAVLDGQADGQTALPAPLYAGAG